MTNSYRVWRIIPGWPDWRSTVLGEFIRNDYISIGWPTDDITGMGDDEIRQELEELHSKLREEWAVERPFDINFAFRMLKIFRDEMKEGDVVIVSADRFIYAVGEITSPYYYDPRPTLYDRYGRPYVYPHKRKVRWLKITKISHNELPEDIKRALELPPTIVEIREDRWNYLLRILLSH